MCKVCRTWLSPVLKQFNCLVWVWLTSPALFGTLWGRDYVTHFFGIFHKPVACSCCSVTQSCLTLANPWIAPWQASLSFIIFWSLLKLMSIELVMPSNHFILFRTLLPSIFPSISVFSNELALHMRWPKYWSFSISPSNEYSELISFRLDWFDLLAVQGTAKSLLQWHNLKASILWAFFVVQLSHHTWLLEKP